MPSMRDLFDECRRDLETGRVGLTREFVERVVEEEIADGLFKVDVGVRGIARRVADRLGLGGSDPEKR